MKFKNLQRKNRLMSIPCPIIGLTGGIATGKTTVSEILKKDGHPLLCADKLVKEIYKENESKEFIKSLAPSSVFQNEIDFKKLREAFFHDKTLKEKIENFLYPKLDQKVYEEFLKMGKKDYLIYDVPLLFEKDLAKLVDCTVVVYAPYEIQLECLCKRDKIVPSLAKDILLNQMPIEEKKRLGDFIIENLGSLEDLEKITHAIFKKILS